MTIPRELKAIAATTIVVAISGLTSLAASARASEREIRVFSLQYSQSDVLGHLLSELMEGKDVKILVHQRTNCPSKYLLHCTNTKCLHQGTRK